MRLYFTLVLSLLILTFSHYEPIEAKDNPTCPSFVQTALQKLGTFCSDALPGSACYGNSGIAVSYANSVSSPRFDSPGDQINLSLINDLHTSAIDLKNKTWGVALVKTQANLPNALNGKGVVLVALGDVRIQSAVSPKDVLQLAEKSVSVVASGKGLDLFNVPPGYNEAYTLLKHVAAGTTFQADGISPNGRWVRVFALHDQPYFQSANAWVKVGEITKTENLATLPTIAPDSFTLMQSINLDTGLQPAACNTDPTSMLYIQGPEEIESQLVINGAELRFGSTILVHILPPGNTMEMIVLSGIGVLNKGGTDERVVTPAFASQICLSEPSDTGVRSVGKDCRWSVPKLLSFSTLEALYRSLDHKIPQKLQYYPTYVPQLVCPSGIGHVQCHILLLYEIFIRHFAKLCQIGVIPKRICDLYAWHGF